MELISDDREVKSCTGHRGTGYLLALPLRRYRDRLLNDACFLPEPCAGCWGVKNYRNTVTFIRNQTFPLINRLAAFILMTEDQGSYQEGVCPGGRVFWSFLQASALCICRAGGEGYLRKEKKSYVILDRAALMELSRDVEVR